MLKIIGISFATVQVINVLQILKVMKRFLITSILATIVAAGTTIMAQEKPDEYLGLPGDNLNLYAVMNLFQESETLEGFERTLNDENSRINNLDLNGDGYIDYLKVRDYVDGDVHTIVLQALLDRNETQDVAVFTVQRFRDGSAQIQLTGDEALYGRNYIIEPIFDETPNPGYYGRSNGAVRTTTVQIAAWPIVRFIYMPTYTIWDSSWYWGYYPSYWHPWRPYYYHYYYGYHYHWYPYYYEHYRHWDSHRYSRWNDFYYNRNRTYSRNVSLRINEGNYRTTYSHPEQRRDGEALYAKVHPDRPTRSSVISTGSDNGRRSSVSTSSSSRQSSGTSASGSRRSGSNESNNPGVNRSSGQNAGSSRRSSNSSATRSDSNTSSGQYSGNSGRSETTVTNKSERVPSPVQSSGNSRRSETSVSNRSDRVPASGQTSNSGRQQTSGSNDRARTNTSASQSNSSSGRSPQATVSDRSASRPQASQRAESNRSSRQSSSASSSGRRSSSNSNSKSSSAGKTTSKSKDSGSTKESRRK